MTPVAVDAARMRLKCITDSEVKVGKALKGRRRQDVVLATKFGVRQGTGRDGPDGRPDSMRQSLERSLQRLGVDYIDLYYQHRMDPAVPIEETRRDRAK